MENQHAEAHRGQDTVWFTPKRRPPMRVFVLKLKAMADDRS
jgi:hypothetical protein